MPVEHHRDSCSVKMGQECRTGRTRAEAKPMEIVPHGEVAQPNEQNLREQLIPCAAPMNPVMAVMVISPKKLSRAFALDAKVSKAPSLKRRRPKLSAISRHIKNTKCINCVGKEKYARTCHTSSLTRRWLYLLIHSRAKTAAVLAHPGAWTVRNTSSNTAQASSSVAQVVKHPLTSCFITICTPPMLPVVYSQYPALCSYGLSLESGLAGSQQYKHTSIEAPHLRTLKAVGWLGSNSRAFPDSTMFRASSNLPNNAILELIQPFNASFDTHLAASLQPCDVIIQWHGNSGFHRNSDCSTVGDFYDIHFQLHNSKTFLCTPKFKTTTQPVIALALFIDPIKNH
ncbi:hypothetical protein B0H14DRAFT_2592993 [Mycena olivaceomarginata]|nr:hypothetical protein B0H14DRAFT_2592993 [Mycena olivaceomarginata]